ILPMHIQGASNILPAGEQHSRPAAVHVSIGAPFAFPDGTTIPEAKQRMADEVRALIPPSA
ncbi:MAG: hypothetical protein IIA90_07565, partial [Chloroflexi bacterium]|nr:hypothetical protein [Chloroflexota bacterium]